MAHIEPANPNFPTSCNVALTTNMQNMLSYPNQDFDDETEEEEEAEVIFYSEGLSNHATSYVYDGAPSAVDTLTNNNWKVPYKYD